MTKCFSPTRGLIFLALSLVLPMFLLGGEKKQLTLEDLTGGSRFSGRGVRGSQWIEKGEAYSYLETDTATKQLNIWRYDVRSGKKTLLVDASNLVLKKGERPFVIQNYLWSPDETRILFTGTLPARSLKSGGNFYLYDLKKEVFEQLTSTEAQQMNVKFSPDGKMIGFVRSNNLVVMDLDRRTETALTNDVADHVMNGHFDWVYEEEFGIIDGWQWSPDSRSIAYWHLDENRVPEFPIMNFIPLHQEITRQRYPVAGDPNSMVRIGVVSVESKQTVWMDLGVPYDSTQDIYVPRIRWTPDNQLLIQRLNRHQNELDYLLADPASGKSKILLTESATTWVNVENDDIFLKESKQFIWVSPRDGYNHLYLYDGDGKLVRQLTQGHWDVDHVVGVNEEKGIVYFTADVTSPLDRDLYSVTLSGTGFARVTKGSGTHTINPSPGMRYFIDSYSDAWTPTRMSLFSGNGSLIRVIEDGKVPALSGVEMGQQSFFTFKTSDGVSLNGWMLKPPQFDSTKKYPVLMMVYGGPGSQTVRNSWGGGGLLWDQLLAEKGYIIVSVDGRGTGGRGREFETITYKNLGKWETHDQIEGAKYLASLTYVDPSRIGITGGSYGGYMTLMCILQGADVFKAGIAVSSVTNWKYYDTIYTERYMETPAENPAGYEESSPMTYADKLKGKLLIIHGTDDDNVHMQNSIVMIDQLVKQNKVFQTALYPGSKHGIRQRLDYYRTLLEFIQENL